MSSLFDNRTCAFIMVGLPGSGKSTFAEKLQKEIENAEIFSSDAIRKELFGSEDIQGEPKVIFSLMKQRFFTALGENKSAIYDATNLSSAKRTALLKSIENGVTKICIYCDTPIEECKKRDAERERHAGFETINKMKNFKEPSETEGFDFVFKTSENNLEMILNTIKYPKESEEEYER